MQTLSTILCIARLAQVQESLVDAYCQMAHLGTTTGTDIRYDEIVMASARCGADVTASLRALRMDPIDRWGISASASKNIKRYPWM